MEKNSNNFDFFSSVYMQCQTNTGNYKQNKVDTTVYNPRDIFCPNNVDYLCTVILIVRHVSVSAATTTCARREDQLFYRSFGILIKHKFQAILVEVTSIIGGCMAAGTQENVVVANRVRFVPLIPSPVRALSFNESGSLLAVGRDNTDIEIWNVSNGWHFERVLGCIHDS